MTQMKSFEMYRLLFPLGILFGLLGGVIWKFSPQWHSHLMVSGFLINFALGYLFTALPRMTGGALPGEGLKIFLMVLVTLSSIFLWLKDSTLFHLTNMIIGLFLVFYLLIQVRIDRARGSHIFLYIAAGMLMFSGFSLARQITIFSVAATSMFQEGVLLAIIIGVGTRMIPTILGQMTIDRDEKLIFMNSKVTWWILSGLFFFSYLLLDTEWKFFGAVLKSLIVSFMGIHYWKIHRKPIKWAPFYVFVIASAWLLCFGLWAQAFTLWDLIIIKHIIGMGGMGLMTLMISSRIIIGHGNYPLQEIDISKEIKAIGILCLGAFALRALPFVPLWGGSALWVCALLIWIKYLFPKIAQIQPRGF